MGPKSAPGAVELEACELDLSGDLIHSIYELYFYIVNCKTNQTEPVRLLLGSSEVAAQRHPHTRLRFRTER